MVIRMKHTKSKKGRVRSHHALSSTTLGYCSHCRAAVKPHTLCQNCGYYKGRQVIDVLSRLDKKERKKKEKELHEHEKEAAERGEPLSAAKLSHQ